MASEVGVASGVAVIAAVGLTTGVGDAFGVAVTVGTGVGVTSSLFSSQATRAMPGSNNMRNSSGGRNLFIADVSYSQPRGLARDEATATPSPPRAP